jgi:type I restriction-modification system DNA methylase subunit
MTEDLKRGVLGLLDDLQKNQAQSLSERDVCRIYIEPLFALLGWNLRNPEEVKEQVSQPQGRPDYIFYLNGGIAFFLETKPFRDLTETDVRQAINYGRSKNKRWSILSNFKETLILLCDTKEDSLWKHVFRKMSAHDLTSHLEDLRLLSKVAFEEGLLDKKAAEEGRIKRTVRIDDELLGDILGWRQRLNASIRKHSKQEYTRLDLEEIVQTLLDRIIFIRTVEDRRHEARPDETIKAILNQYDNDKSTNIRDQMNKLFRHYDEIYDSRLFTYDMNDSNKRHECERVDIDNLTYARILRETYDKNEIYSYNFADIDADVLGTMYEKYIGTMQAKRRQQGIYYTPPFVVEYIVENTLGKLLNKVKVEDFSSIKVLDMACGSGSFLLKSFDLLDRYYRQKDRNYAQTKLDSETDAAKMTRKSMILRNNIFGVDLDPKAVEIAQLNLLLKAAETRFRLPDLRDNIKCGNSLISQSLDEGMRPFDWSREFSKIIHSGGFDVVIGNPPYVRQEELLKIKPNLEMNYEVYHSMADLSVYFFEREIKMLKDGGLLGMIVTNKWLKAGYGKKLRQFLNRYCLEQIIDFGDLRVFQDAAAYPCILIVKKKKAPNKKVLACQVKSLDFENLGEYVLKKSFRINQKELTDGAWNIVAGKTGDLLERIKSNCITLQEKYGNEVYRGILTGLSEAFVIDENTRNQLISEDPKSEELIVPFLTGKDVRAYGIDFKKKYLILTRIGVRIDEYPAIFERLKRYKAKLEKRWDQGDHWYELRSCDYYELFKEPKLVYAKFLVKPRFALDFKGFYVNDANFFIPTTDKQLLAILNSKVGWFLISNNCTQIRGGYQLIWKYFANVAVPRPRSPELERESETMIRLTERLIALGRKQTDERVKLEREVKETSGRIDDLVYELYRLTTEDKRTVEDIMRKI